MNLDHLAIALLVLAIVALGLVVVAQTFILF